MFVTTTGPVRIPDDGHVVVRLGPILVPRRPRPISHRSCRFSVENKRRRLLGACGVPIVENIVEIQDRRRHATSLTVENRRRRSDDVIHNSVVRPLPVT